MNDTQRDPNPQAFRNPNTLPYRGKFSRAGSIRYFGHARMAGQEVAYDLAPEKTTRRLDISQQMAQDLYLVEQSVLVSEGVHDEKTGTLVGGNLHMQPAGRFIGGIAEVSETEDENAQADIIGHHAWVPATDRIATGA